MTVKRAVCFTTFLFVLSSVLAVSTPASGVVPPGNHDYLGDNDKKKVCNYDPDDDLCIKVGTNDTVCKGLSATVNGTNSTCIQVRICSFVVVPTTSPSPSGYVTTPSTYTTAKPELKHTTVAPPPPVIPQLNTIYVTDFEVSEVPDNFLVTYECSEDSLYSFVYPVQANPPK